MEKVIDGKHYSSRNAEEIGSRKKGIQGDFDRVRETLYRTENGRYFLQGYGGARSKYAKKNKHGDLMDGSDLIALSDEEALSWAERHLDGAKVKDEFEDMVEPA